MVDATSTTDPIILCGLDKLAFRILEHLSSSGSKVTVIARSADEAFEEQTIALGVRVVQGDYRDEPVLREAGIDDAAAIVLVEDDDVGNVHAALTSQERNPDIRIVLRMFNLDFGQQIQALFKHCQVLSSSATAAPAFVAAALYEDDGQRFIVSRRVYALRQTSPSDDDVLLPVARVTDDGIVLLFPEDGGEALCIVDEGAEVRLGSPATHDNALAYARNRLKPHNFLRAIVTDGEIDKRLFYLMGLLFCIAIVSTILFNYFRHLSLVDAIYVTITLMTTAAFGDINLRDAPPAIKLFGAILMLIGAIALAVTYALITDMLMKARFSGLGDRYGKLNHHIVVSGLGNVGFRIAEQLVGLGMRVAAVELRESNAFVNAARRLGISVLVADTRLPSTLHALHVERAACLIAATDDDIANLQTALNARTIRQDLRIVMRLFEPDFAERVQRTFKIDACHSVSALAAPSFAAAATGLPVVAKLPIGAMALVVARITIAVGSGLDSLPVAEVERRSRSRILFAGPNGETAWRPPPGAILFGGQEIIVVGDPEGLTELWAHNRPKAVSSESTLG